MTLSSAGHVNCARVAAMLCLFGSAHGGPLFPATHGSRSLLFRFAGDERLFGAILHSPNSEIMPGGCGLVRLEFLFAEQWTLRRREWCSRSASVRRSSASAVSRTTIVAGSRPMKENVGYIWIGDSTGIRLKHLGTMRPMPGGPPARTEPPPTRRRRGSLRRRG